MQVIGLPPRNGVQNRLCAGARIGPQGGFRLGVERTGLDDVAAADLSERQAHHRDNLAGIAPETIRNQGDRDQLKAFFGAPLQNMKNTASLPKAQDGASTA